ncbi:YaaA family protein [Georgenia wangjunii]|uniref:YaaA family protein n=1 Tax=Georgenia wangjunii TaxID=3117730 RepID=UPI002F264E46
MLILLPPSEGKTGRARGKPHDPAALAFPTLAAARAEVAATLADVSARPDAAAVLGVSPALTEDIARNTRLAQAPGVRAGALYSGVLYDALGYATLDPAARRRANRRLVVVSALYGAVRPTDVLAPYRLSMGAALPGLGRLASFWRPHLDEALPAAVGRGVIVDGRSSTYAAAWSPRGAHAERWVHVRVPGATHMAKHTRGLVARYLCGVEGDVATPSALAEVLTGAFDVALEPPARAGTPWVLQTRVLPA